MSKTFVLLILLIASISCVNLNNAFNDLDGPCSVAVKKHITGVITLNASLAHSAYSPAGIKADHKHIIMEYDAASKKCYPVVLPDGSTRIDALITNSYTQLGEIFAFVFATGLQQFLLEKQNVYGKSIYGLPRSNRLNMNLRANREIKWEGYSAVARNPNPIVINGTTVYPGLRQISVESVDYTFRCRYNNGEAKVKRLDAVDHEILIKDPALITKIYDDCTTPAQRDQVMMDWYDNNPAVKSCFVTQSF